jgi:DNA invertase Pin-like site-specific DNA recombinase
MQYISAMLIGYARVSTNEQETAAQAAALKVAGCGRVFHEKESGGRWNRSELHKILDQLRKGDVLVPWNLDRLSHSLQDVLTIRERLEEYQPGFRNLSEAIRHAMRTHERWVGIREARRSHRRTASGFFRFIRQRFHDLCLSAA